MLPRPFARLPAISILWMLVLAMLALGMPRLVLVCNEPCCDGRVALSRSCGERDRAATANETEEDATADCPCCRARRHAEDGAAVLDIDCGCLGCAHRALGCDLEPPTSPLAFPAPPLLRAWAPIGEHLATLVTSLQRRDACATGPPHAPARHVATTVLRL